MHSPAATRVHWSELCRRFRTLRACFAIIFGGIWKQSAFRATRRPGAELLYETEFLEDFFEDFRGHSESAQTTARYLRDDA